jgi:hypothetical protein
VFNVVPVRLKQSDYNTVCTRGGTSYPDSVTFDFFYRDYLIPDKISWSVLVSKRVLGLVVFRAKASKNLYTECLYLL